MCCDLICLVVTGLATLGSDGPRVAYSNSSSNGPWILYNDGLPLFSPNSSVWYYHGVTNPAPVILANGTVLFYFAGSPDLKRCPHTASCIAMARAPHWTGPYQVLGDGGITTPDAGIYVTWHPMFRCIYIVYIIVLFSLSNV